MSWSPRPPPAWGGSSRCLNDPASVGQAGVVGVCVDEVLPAFPGRQRKSVPPGVPWSPWLLFLAVRVDARSLDVHVGDVVVLTRFPVDGRAVAYPVRAACGLQGVRVRAADAARPWSRRGSAHRRHPGDCVRRCLSASPLGQHLACVTPGESPNGAWTHRQVGPGALIPSPRAAVFAKPIRATS